MKTLLFLILGLCGLAANVAPAEVPACQRFRSALRSAEELRHLSTRTPVKCRTVNRNQFLTIIQNALMQDSPPSQLENEGLALRLLGFIPATYDYKRCALSAAADNVLAFYQPELKAVIIPDWINTPQEILVHEAVHALQDQHFDLLRLRRASLRSGDRYQALAALAEGDASLVQVNFKNLAKEESTPAATSHPDSGCSAPPFLAAELDFPYAYGQFFVGTVVESAKYATLDQLFDKPPRTTHEILYPRQFLSGKLAPARHIHTPKARGALLYSDSVGEGALRTYLKLAVGPQAGVLAAKGWLGDKLALYSRGKRVELVWRLIWENELEATQFKLAFLQAQSQRFAFSFNATSAALDFSSGNISFSFRQNGSETLIEFSDYNREH